jgi:hypothetical protein
MNRIGIALLAAVLATSPCFSQSSTAASSQAAATTIGHGSFPVKVVKTLDSSKLKEGDTVEVETAGSFKLADGMLVPKGSKLMGHVTAAKARSKGDPDSQLTLAFDRLNVINGKQLTVKGAVQAVFPASEEAEPQMAGKASGAAGGGYVGATTGTVTDSKSGSNMQNSNSQSSMNPQSVGVHGIHGLELNDGALSSQGKNVKLGGGVQMIVKVDILG